MVLTELAWDDLELARRMVDNEVLYYAREQSRDEQKRIHYLLIDASASMRGDRQTFARGMAIATGKKLLLEGEEVAFRFFDSRLYEVHRARTDSCRRRTCFASRASAAATRRASSPSSPPIWRSARTRSARSPVVHLFTHAALYIPREMVQAVRRHAHLAACSSCPRGGEALDLDYLDLLDGHWVVDHATLSEKTARAAAATKIVNDAAELNERVPASMQPRSLRTTEESVPPSLRPSRTSMPPPPR